MPDEFGGIAVDEPTTDEFGGIAVSNAPQSMPPVEISPYQKARLSGMEPVAGPFGPASPEEVPALLEAAQKPFVSLPETTAKGPLAAAYRGVVKPLIEGIESPAGLLTLPLLAESAPARIAAGIGFGGMAAKSGLEKMQSQDPQTQLEGRMELAAAPLFALAPGAEKAKVPVKAFEETTPKVNISEKVPPVAVTREAQPSEAPVGAGTEGAAVTAPTPQPLPETKPVEPTTQAKTVTTPVTQETLGPRRTDPR